MVLDLEQLKVERDLITAIRRGESQAWGGIYDLYADRLYRSILMPRLAQPVAAEDALAETFKAAIEKIDSFSDQGGGIFPWLCRIAHNKAMDMHRAKKTTGRKIQDLSQLLRPVSVQVAGAEELLVQIGQSQLLTTRMKDAMALLNPRYKRVIELRFFEERPRHECATLMEVKTGTWDVLLLRALHALKANWEELVPPSSGARR